MTKDKNETFELTEEEKGVLTEIMRRWHKDNTHKEDIPFKYFIKEFLRDFTELMINPLESINESLRDPYNPNEEEWS